MREEWKEGSAKEKWAEERMREGGERTGQKR
jgi:hypothetical protein